MPPLCCFDAEATSLDIPHLEQHLQLSINLFLGVFLSHYTMSMLPKIPDRGALTAFPFSSVNFNVLLAIRSSRAGNLLAFTVDYTLSHLKYPKIPQLCISCAAGAWIKLSNYL